MTGDPIGATSDAGDRGGFYRERDEIFPLEIVDVALAAGAGDGLGFQRQHREKIGQSPAAEHRIEPLGQFGILRRDPGGIAAFMPVVIGAGGGAERLVFRLQLRIIVAERDQRRGADGDGIGAKRQRLGHVGAITDAAGDDQLHLAVHAELLQRLHRRPDRCQRRDADVLDRLLRRRRAALHAVDHDHVGAGLHRQARCRNRRLAPTLT